MTRALVLDCDGVLADTELDGHLVAFNRTFDELGFGFTWSADEYGELLRVGGGMLIVVGLLLVTGWWERLTAALRQWAASFSTII